MDVLVNASGGGPTGQAGAIIMGLGRALVRFDSTLEPALRGAGFLTRDSRMKERKKYGQRGARRKVPVLEAIIASPITEISKPGDMRLRAFSFALSSPEDTGKQVCPCHPEKTQFRAIRSSNSAKAVLMDLRAESLYLAFSRLEPSTSSRAVRRGPDGGPDLGGDPSCRRRGPAPGVPAPRFSSRSRMARA